MYRNGSTFLDNCIKEYNCEIKTEEDYVSNNSEVSLEDPNYCQGFQSDDIVINRNNLSTDKFKLEMESHDKTNKIKEEVIDDSMFKIKSEKNQNDNTGNAKFSKFSFVKKEFDSFQENDNKQKPFNTLDCSGENNCDIKTEENYMSSDSPILRSLLKRGYDDLNNCKVFQSNGMVSNRNDLSSDQYKLVIESQDKVIKIEKEIIGTSVYESEIVIEKNDSLQFFNEDKSKTDSDNKLLISHRQLHPSNVSSISDNTKKLFLKNSKCSSSRKTKTKKKTFKCQICKKNFNDQSNYIRHTKIHYHEEKFKCDVCLKTFTRKSNLSVHFRKHTGEKPYKCDICQLSFQRNDCLKKHKLLTHEKKKPTFTCDVCQKVFDNKYCLSRHLKIHENYKPYHCHVCRRSFIRKYSLIVHLRSKHFVEKPFECDICQKSFFEKNVLNRHKKTHLN